ncbi:MAG: hypothetical protein KBG73_04925 [Candidatus Promineofilum sp.]|nr:hypothetical protein [Promineifilum sp.]
MSLNTTKIGQDETLVLYTLIHDGELIVIENVPARVDSETGEQFFSPQTVERLQSIVWNRRRPARIMQTPVYEFAG